MNWSKFIFKTDLNNKVLLYNTISGELISLEKKIFTALTDDNNKEHDEIIKYLIENEYIYNEKDNEYDRFYKKVKDEWNNSKFLSLHIVMTTACNFNCLYCYQDGIKIQTLTEKAFQNHIKYLEKYIVDNKIEETSIEITGGEPTLNKKIIKSLLEQLELIFKKHGVKYDTKIVSNGYLLNKKFIDLLIQYNLKRVQITIDGLKKTHNFRRSMKNGEDSYDDIISNLKYIINTNAVNNVILRINYDNQNFEEVPLLLEHLNNELDIEKINLSFGLITKTVEGTDANIFIKKYGISSKEFSSKYATLYEHALLLGYNMPDFFAFSGMCTAKLKHGFILLPNGELVKCVSAVGRDEFVIGKTQSNNNNLENYFFLDNLEKCIEKECCFLPICYMGCVFESFTETGSKRNIICKYDELVEINKTILAIKYGDNDVSSK